jgi:DNA-directed RNA polymerase subunit delta
MKTPGKSKKHVIVDYKNITQELLHLLTDTYPDGYEDETITFNNAKGERVEAVRLETEDSVYLVKVSAQLGRKVEIFIDDQDDETDAVIDAETDVPDADFEDE